jgi:hypothetical protein
VGKRGDKWVDNFRRWVVKLVELLDEALSAAHNAGMEDAAEMEGVSWTGRGSEAEAVIAEAARKVLVEALERPLLGFDLRLVDVSCGSGRGFSPGYKLFVNDVEWVFPSGASVGWTEAEILLAFFESLGAKTSLI